MDATERNKTDGTGQAPSLGQVLKAGLTLEQLSTELRIEARQLQALEQDELERIGPPVFVKGYLRTYGQRVGLDYGDLLSLYYKQAERRDLLVQPSRSITLRDERQITVWIVAAIVLVVVMAALAVWWWLSSTPAPVAASAPPAAAAPRVERLQPAADEAREAEPASVAAAAPPPVTEASGSNGPTVTQPIADAGSPSAAADAPPAASSGFPAAAPLLELTLSFAQESWVEISDAHGERLFYGLGRAGRRAALTGEPPILVLLGNAEGVQLTMNGADYPIPPGRQGKLARFTLTAPD
jgi:cytoskeleton protein RodZ